MSNEHTDGSRSGGEAAGSDADILEEMRFTYEVVCAEGYNDPDYTEALDYEIETRGWEAAFAVAVAKLRQPTQNGGLVKAATALYTAGRWSCDQEVDEASLWAALRDALGLPVGTETGRAISALRSHAESDCDSCGGLNTSCPEGCERDPATGELLLMSTQSDAVRVTDEMVDQAQKELAMMSGFSIVYPNASRVRKALEAALAVWENGYTKET